MSTIEQVRQVDQQVWYQVQYARQLVARQAAQQVQQGIPWTNHWWAGQPRAVLVWWRPFQQAMYVVQGGLQAVLR